MAFGKTESRAKAFVEQMYLYMGENIVSQVSEKGVKAAEKLLKELKKFAVADEFSSFLIVDVYNEIKIALLKWNCFADKQNKDAIEQKKILDEMFAIIEDFYFYEIFGFFSTTVWPHDVDGLKLPCRIFCGCANGWQKEPVLTTDGKVKFENVIRFENSQPDSEEKELLCMTISSQPEILEGKGKCIYSDEQIEELKSFVRENRDIIILHNAGIIDSAGFLNALSVRNDSDNHSVKYRIRFCYKENFGTISFPLTPHYVAFDDESYDEAKLFYEKLKVELKETPEDKKGDFWLEDFDVLTPEEDTGKCCFCGAVFNGRGNSTWPIYFEQDGEKNRCCENCNEEYVGAARKDKALIMQFREKFGICYARYE